MTTVKTEGFKVPGAMAMPPPARPHVHRPFSDGSMVIETDVLASLDQSYPMSSPFNFAHSLPNQTSIHQFMTSPPSSLLDLDSTSPSSSLLHLSSLRSDMFHPFNSSNPEPPVTFPPADAHAFVGKVPTSRSKAPRKLSMSDNRPKLGRPPIPHPRTLSYSDAGSSRFGLGIQAGLDTHKEGERTDSISPPEFNAFGVTIPQYSSASSHAPSLVPGSFGSYSLPDDAIMDSPITPAQALPPQLPDDTYKKQRRRECHNQVEKRRREHINAKIEELSQLVPAHYHQTEEVVEEEEEEEPVSGKKKKNKRSGSTAKQQKDAAHCKGRILSQSVQYIYDLKHITAMQAARIQHLETLLSVGSNNPPFLWPNGDSTHSIDQAFIPMPFEPSPTDQSSGSNDHYRRSSSLSTAESAEESKPIFGSPMQEAQGRRVSDIELSMPMSNMDIDAMMRGDGSLRW